MLWNHIRLLCSPLGTSGFSLGACGAGTLRTFTALFSLWATEELQHAFNFSKISLST